MPCRSGEIRKFICSCSEAGNCRQRGIKRLEILTERGGHFGNEPVQITIIKHIQPTFVGGVLRQRCRDKTGLPNSFVYLCAGCFTK
jgi:hypothetical protein